MRKALLFILGGFLLTVGACVPPESEAAADDVLLAKVYNKPLYLSEMDGMIPRWSSKEDSTLMVNAYVERWVRENLMLYEAERNVPGDLNIDALVRDYRASLVLNSYEKQLIETQLDSTVTDDEVLNYYNKYKTHFQLETNIVRCKFMKLPLDAPDEDKVAKWWESDTLPGMRLLRDYCEEHAVVYQLEDSTWIEIKDLEEQFPKGALSSIKEGKEFTLEEGDFKYYIRVMEIESDNNDPPLGYIRERALRHILHNRKMTLIDAEREKLYRKAERMGHIKYFH